MLEKDDFGDGVEDRVTVSGRQVAEKAMSMSGAQAGGKRVSAEMEGCLELVVFLR